MKITLNLLLTKLFMDYPELRIELPKSRLDDEICGVRLLPMGTDIKLREDILYVFDDAHPLNDSDIVDHIHYLKICPGAPSEVIQERLIHINTSIELAVFLNILQDIYALFKAWYDALEHVLIDNGSVQQLIDLSERIIGAPFLIYDPSLKIIGNTSNIETDDRIFNLAVQHGYLPDDLIQHFKSEDVFKKLNTEGVSEGDINEFRDHHDFIILLQSGDTMLGHGVLLQDDTDREYQVYLFRILCDLISQSMKQNLQQSAIYDYLLSDILDRNLTDTEVIKERVKYINVKYDSAYALALLRFTDQNNVPQRFIINTLTSLLPTSKSFFYKGDILILITLRDLSKEKYMRQIQKIRNRLQIELDKHNLRACISKSFNCITDLPTAYEQCIIGLEMGDPDNDFIFYEDYWLQHIFSLCNDSVPLSSFCEPVVREIASMKQTGAVSPLVILRTYLECDRSLTQCSKLLHMHRNNVLYHITRLADMYNLDLDNSEQRLRLLISMKIYDYTESLE